MILKIGQVSYDDLTDLARFLAGKENVLRDGGRVAELKEAKEGSPVFHLNLVIEINDRATRSEINPFFESLGIFRDL